MKTTIFAIASLFILNSQAVTFKNHGNMPNHQNIQLDEKRDPLLSFVPTPRDMGYPINYGVPNFGRDKDVQDTMDHIEEAERK